MKRVDVNVDIAEGFAWDSALLELATSANICLGEHAGSVLLWAETAEQCRVKGVRVGGHPGFPDRVNMGRLGPEPDQEQEWYHSVIRQCLTFHTVQPDAAYIKPHGAWYNLISQGNPSAVAAIREAHQSTGLPIMLLAGHDLEIPTILEGFPERGYGADGRLLPRSEPGALLHDDASIATQAIRLAETCDSLCVHGDSPDCAHKLEVVVRALIDAGYEVGF